MKEKTFETLQRWWPTAKVICICCACIAAAHLFRWI